MRQRLLFMLILLSLTAALVVAACTPKQAAKPPSPTPLAAPVAEGKVFYGQKCAACHGPNAEGTAAGPAIAGHSMSAIKTQVRNPMGTMMAFPPSQLSDRELNEVAEFVAGLAGAKAPVKEWEKQTTETIHHWMAMLAIKGNNTEDTKHHLQDVLAYIPKSMHRAEIEKTLNLIAQGNVHDAEHEIEEMAGAQSPSGITIRRFHLVLAQRGIEAKSAIEVKHHLDHFLAKATAAERKIVQEALELVEKGDLHEAEHEVEELLNMSK